MDFFSSGKSQLSEASHIHDKSRRSDASSNLNDQLTEYIQNMRDLRVSSARALGKAHYDQSLLRMEKEMMKIKLAYEEQMEKMRIDAQETTDKNIELTQALAENKQQLEELQRRVIQDESTISAAHGYEGDLRQALSQRQADANRMKDELSITLDRYSFIKAEHDLLLANKDELLKKLNNEIQKRLELEARLMKLQEDKEFHSKLHNQTESDLHERISIANRIIQSLDDKLKELGQLTHQQLPKMLKHIRDTTTNEMHQFHSETEEKLSKTIASLKRQMDEEQRNKIKAEKDKELLQKVTLSHEEVEKDLLAQNQALRDQLQVIKQELENEQNKSKIKTMEHEQAIKNLENDLIDKAQEFIRAREAQAKLKVEIDTYKEMLQNENNTLRLQNEKLPTIDLPMVQKAVKVVNSPHDNSSAQQKSVLNVPNVPPGDPFRPGYQTLKSPKLPPIQGQSSMSGILSNYKNQQFFNNYMYVNTNTARMPWSTYETTYGKSFTPKPMNKFYKPYAKYYK